MLVCDHPHLEQKINTAASASADDGSSTYFWDVKVNMVWLLENEVLIESEEAYFNKLISGSSCETCTSLNCSLGHTLAFGGELLQLLGDGTAVQIIYADSFFNTIICTIKCTSAAIPRNLHCLHVSMVRPSCYQLQKACNALSSNIVRWQCAAQD